MTTWSLWSFQQIIERDPEEELGCFAEAAPVGIKQTHMYRRYLSNPIADEPGQYETSNDDELGLARMSLASSVTENPKEDPEVCQVPNDGQLFDQKRVKVLAVAKLP